LIYFGHASQCTIVDFTVTQKGLEEQLLGRVIQKEQRSLEESLKNVLEEVNGNTKALLRLDQLLLERLSENTVRTVLETMYYRLYSIDYRL
jgi:dynein heavy chain